MDAPYAEFYAKKLVEKLGLSKLSKKPFAELTLLVAFELAPFDPEGRDVIAVTSGIQKLIRDMAPPADLPRQRGTGRMYR